MNKEYLSCIVLCLSYFTQALSEAITFTWMCDNGAIIFADGVQVGLNKGRKTVKTVEINDTTEMLTFILNDNGGAYGFMAKHSLGWYTGAGNLVCAANVDGQGDTWHMKEFNDRSWQNATKVTHNKQDIGESRAQSVWNWPYNETVYCRHKLYLMRMASQYINLTWACDDEAIIYADGVKVGSSNNYKISNTVEIARSTAVIGFVLIDFSAAYGFIAKHSMGWYTKPQGDNLVCTGNSRYITNDWHSRGFDDSTWTNSRAGKAGHLKINDENAKNIWGDPYNATVYCRHKLYLMERWEESENKESQNEWNKWGPWSHTGSVGMFKRKMMKLDNENNAYEEQQEKICKSAILVDIKNDVEVKNHLIGVVSGKSVLDCCLLCKQTLGCMSVNMYPTGQLYTCQLNDITMDDANADDTQVNVGVVYAQLDVDGSSCD